MKPYVILEVMMSRLGLHNLKAIGKLKLKLIPLLSCVALVLSGTGVSFSQGTPSPPQAAGDKAPLTQAIRKQANEKPPRSGQKVMTPFGPIFVGGALEGAWVLVQEEGPEAAGEPAPAAANPQQPPPEPPPAAEQKPAPAVEPPPPAPEQPPAEDGSAVAFNLENADLYQVLRILGSELGINYVVDPAVKGTVTISTSARVTRADLFSLLQTILQINGAAAVKTDGYYRIVPLPNARVLPLPLNYGKEAEQPAPPEQPLALQVVPMRYVSAGEMSRILTPFVSPAGQIVILEQGNILIIVDTTAKLKQLQEMIEIFDSQVFSRQRVALFPVVHTLAKNLVAELESIFSGYGLSKGSAIHFVPLDRLNALLAISPSPEVFAEVEQWIARLDQPAPETGVRNYVYRLQNAKASDLRDLLIELYGGQVPRPQPSAALPESVRPGLPPQVTVAPPPPPAAPPEAAARIQGEIRILSDEKNNALIIQASPHDYEIIERTLRELDVLPRQVLIDARIYEVDLSDDLAFGLSAFLDRKEKLPGDLTTKASIAGGRAGGVLQASTFAVIGNTRALQGFLTADENRTRVRALSAPSILVTDNTSARIQVGSEVPVPIGSSLTPIESGGTSLFAQTIQFRDTGVILTVTPRINASGIVTLNVQQEVSTAIPNTTSDIVAPVINKSSFQTAVVLQDRETLALGGIITESDSYATNRLPLIGRVPGLGLLLGATTKRRARKELVLLLTPHVIHNIPQGLAASGEFIDRLREVKKTMKQFNVD